MNSRTRLPSLFDELIRTLAAELIGKCYDSLKLRSCYLIVGGLIHKSVIDLHGIHTDTRQPFLVAIEPGFGKSTILQFIFMILDGVAVVRRPANLWPEQLIGKTILRRVKGTDVTTPKPGYFAYSFILVDEASRWLRRNDRIAQDLWAIIRLAHDTYGRNWIEKERTSDLQKDILRYLAECVMMVFMQPTRVLHDYLEDGTLRRLLPSVHEISTNEKERIVKRRGLASQPARGDIENVKTTLKLLNQLSIHWTFTDEAITLISNKTLVLIRDGESHPSNAVRSYVRYMHTTVQNRLCGMAAILAVSEYSQGKKEEDFRLSNGPQESYKFEAYVEITARHVRLASDHLGLFLQEAFDFFDRLISTGNGSSVISSRQFRALKILKDWGCISEDTSTRAIKSYLSEVASLLECSTHNARRIYNRLKKNRLIASKQPGSHVSRVWLTPEGLRILESEGVRFQ